MTTWSGSWTRTMRTTSSAMLKMRSRRKQLKKHRTGLIRMTTTKKKIVTRMTATTTTTLNSLPLKRPGLVSLVGTT